jgi:uncharacterized protein (TIGR02597 family)
MKVHRLPLLAATAFAGLAQLNAQTTVVATDPVGFVKLTIAAGLSGKVSTLFSAPLLANAEIAGQASGSITGVTSNTISNSSGGWADNLANPASPYLVLLTSGLAKGRMFLISANTDTQLTINADDLAAGDLPASGVAVEDTYKIFRCDTLLSLFGTPADDGVTGGPNAKSADTVLLTGPQGPKTYYYSTGQNQWVENSRGVVPANNVPVRPYYGVLYSRLGPALDYTVMGGVPTVPRAVAIANSGTTLLAQYWPTSRTLSQLGLQNTQGWLAGPNAKSADRVVINDPNGVPTTYFYNGANWMLNARTPTVSNDVVIPIGAAIEVQRRNSNLGYAILDQLVPYTL